MTSNKPKWLLCQDPQEKTDFYLLHTEEPKFLSRILFDVEEIFEDDEEMKQHHRSDFAMADGHMFVDTMFIDEPKTAKGMVELWLEAEEQVMLYYETNT